MNDTQQAKRKDRQAAALLASIGIIVGFIVYWSVEIQAALEMLELAYG